MFNANQLSDAEKGQILAWAADGAQLGDLQKKMAEEFGIQLTYMDTRFMVLDLGVELVIEKPVNLATAAEDITIGTGVVVTVDEIVRPGAIVSGRVTFSDGEKALWALDQMGQFSLDSDTAGYRPAEADMLLFQDQLRLILA